ncbi:hypothetical protein JCM8208_005455 [Rhodotorula glutinis]
MPSGSDSSSSDLEIIVSSTSRRATRPVPTSSNLASAGTSSSAHHPDRASPAPSFSKAPQHKSAVNVQVGSRRAQDSASGSSPQVDAAAQAAGSMGSTVQQGAAKGEGKGKGKLVETIELSSSDDSEDEGLPPPSTLSQTRPRPDAKPQPRISLPYPPTAHRPRPAPRRSEPAARSLATVTLSSSSSEDDAEKQPQLATAPAARPSSSQGVAASGTTSPAGAQPVAPRVPRATLQAKDAARAGASPVSASREPGRGAAPPLPSAREQLATTSQARPSPSTTRLPAAIRKSISSTAPQPPSTSVKPPGAAALTSAARTSLPALQPRPPTSSRTRPPASPSPHLIDAGQVRLSSPPVAAHHEPAPSTNRLPNVILSKYGPAAPPTSSSSSSRAAAEPLRPPPTASATRATSSVESDIQYDRLGRLAVRASSSSKPQHEPQLRLQLERQVQAQTPVASVVRGSAGEASQGASSPRERAEPGRLSAAEHVAEPLRSAEGAGGASPASGGVARAARGGSSAVGEAAAAPEAAAAVGSAQEPSMSGAAVDKAGAEQQEQLVGEVGRRATSSVGVRAGKKATAASTAAPAARRRSTSTAVSREYAPAEQLGVGDDLAEHVPVAARLGRLDSAARAPHAAPVVAQHPTAAPIGAPQPGYGDAGTAIARAATAVDSVVQTMTAGGRSSASRPADGPPNPDVPMHKGVVEEQEKGNEMGRAADAGGGAVDEGAQPTQHVLGSQPRSRAASLSSSTTSAGAARLNTARKSTAGIVPPAARSRPVARKSMGSRQAGAARDPSSAAPSNQSAPPAPLALLRGAGTARKSTDGRQVRATAAPTRATTTTSSSSSSSSSSPSAIDDSDSDSASSSRAGTAPPPQPEHVIASPSLAVPDLSTLKGSFSTSTARRPATGRKSTAGRAPVVPSRSTRSVEPPAAAHTAKRKGPPSPASSTTSTDAPQKKRRRYADDGIVAAGASREGDQLVSGRRLRKTRSRVDEVVVQQAEPLVLEPDTAVAVEMGDQDKVAGIEDQIKQFKRTEASERPWNRLIAGPSFDLDAEFDTTIQNEVNRRERRWARRHPHEHPLRESYKTLFELMILEANAKEYSPHEPARRPKIRILPPAGQSAQHWSSPPFEFIYTNRVIYSDGICPVQAPGCECEGNCGSSSNRAKCACRRRQIDASTTRPGGEARSGHRDFAYVDGKLVDDVFIDQDPIIECNSECGCGPECINRVVGRRPSLSVDIYHTGQNGWGVRLPPTYTDELGDVHVACVIKRGEPLAIYAGELLRTADADARARFVYSYMSRTYIYDLDSWTIPEDIQALAPLDAPFQSGVVQKDSAHMSAEHAVPSNQAKGKSKKKKKSTPAPAEEDDDAPVFSSLYSIDAFNVGNWTRFANHVCSGFNAAPRPVYVDDYDVSRPLWVYFALRDILPGDEITISYAGETEPDPTTWGYTRAQWKAAADESRRKADKAQRCYCGKALCRGRMFNNEAAAFWTRGEGLARS